MKLLTNKNPYFFSFKFQTDQGTYFETDCLPVRLLEETEIIVLEQHFHTGRSIGHLTLDQMIFFPSQ